MSPEQARGKPVDRRADIWAFGVVLMEMLTGRRVFAGDNVVEVLGRVLNTEPDWKGLPPDTPRAVPAPAAVDVQKGSTAGARRHP
jgi:serine/threonine-protein kinase